MNRTKNFLVLALGAIAVTGNAQSFTSESSFVAAINPNYYHESFSGFTFGSPLNGTQTDYDAAGNGVYNWHAFAAEGLYSNNHALSTNYAYDTLVITFGNSPNAVNAIGGNFQETDFNGNTLAFDINLTFSDGHNVTLSNQTGSSFYGYISSSAITELDIVSDNNATLDWVQAGNFYVGHSTAAPEPASIALLGLGGLALLRRKRNRA